MHGEDGRRIPLRPGTATRYIDFLQAGGPTILGSNYPAVREKVIELLNTCGPVTGLLHESEMMIAKEITKHMPNVEMFRMLGSGTESVMAALRIARIATGKKRIIKIGGAYHGWSDQMVYGLKIPGSRALLESHGITPGAYRRTDEVRPNDLDMLEKMMKTQQAERRYCSRYRRAGRSGKRHETGRKGL